MGDPVLHSPAAPVVPAPRPGVLPPLDRAVWPPHGGGFVRTNLPGAVDDPVAAVGRRAVMRTRPIATDATGVQAIGYEFEVPEQS